MAEWAKLLLELLTAAIKARTEAVRAKALRKLEAEAAHQAELNESRARWKARRK